MWTFLNKSKLLWIIGHDKIYTDDEKTFLIIKKNFSHDLFFLLLTKRGQAILLFFQRYFFLLLFLFICWQSGDKNIYPIGCLPAARTMYLPIEGADLLSTMIASVPGEFSYISHSIFQYIWRRMDKSRDVFQ